MMCRFGDLLYYTSPNKQRKKRCVFVRDDDGKAVVLFEDAEFVARVNYVYLSSRPMFTAPDSYPPITLYYS